MSVGQLAGGRLVARWREPLYRSGYLLVANSAITAAVGVGYWAFAARLYPPNVVGANSAAISAMMFLAGVAQLNLMSALLRFVPVAGSATPRMIRTAYLVGAGLSGIAAVIFLAGLSHWAPGLRELLRPGPASVAFVVATMGWAVFVMQDTALVAVGRTIAVPVENLCFALLKIALVIAFAGLLPRAGIWFAWTAGMAVAVGGTTAYLFRRAIPTFTTSAPLAASAPSRRDLGRYIGPDYLGSLAWIASTALMPVLVLDLTDARHAAAFALAWSVGGSLYQVPAAFGESLVAYGVADRARLDQHHRQVRRHTVQLLTPAVVVLVLAAPNVLSLFGPYYAEHGATTLRLLALSALPNAVVALEISRARAASQMRTVVAVLTGLSAIVLGLTVLLVPRVGIAGAGVAWLVAEAMVATFLLGARPALPGAVRPVRPVRVGGATRAVRRVLADVPDGWSAQRRVSTVSDTTVVLVCSGSGRSGVLKVSRTECGAAALLHEVDVLGRLWSEDRLGTWRTLLPTILATANGDAAGYLLASRLPGRDGRHTAGGNGTGLTATALAAIAPLHRLGARATCADPALLTRWVDEPAELLCTALRTGAHRNAVDQLVTELRAELAGQPVTLGWAHGDFYPGNLLLAPDGAVSGIVDWDQGRADDLAVLDIVHWLLTVPRPGRRPAYGAQVADRLAADRCWSGNETALLEPGGAALSGRALLMLGWLRHVAGNLGKSTRYAESPLWLRRNVVPVLRQVLDG